MGQVPTNGGQVAHQRVANDPSGVRDNRVLRPHELRTFEVSLAGKRLDQDDITQAAQLAAEAARPEADLRGSSEYKRDMVRVLTARALTRALQRAGGQVA